MSLLAGVEVDEELHLLADALPNTWFVEDDVAFDDFEVSDGLEF